MATHTAAIIDPGFSSSAALIPIIEKHHLQLSAILLTHSHWDHIAEVALWRQKFDVPVYLHPLDQSNLEQPGSDRLRMPRHIESYHGSLPLSEGQEILIGFHSLIVIHTPGHSPGGVCFYNAADAVLFSGDTLFRGTIGNLSFPTSVPTQMWPSLHKLAALPGKTVVYPGHGETTTIAAENWLNDAEKMFKP
jgi:hydroxyacylglutathione hydrolase